MDASTVLLLKAVGVLGFSPLLCTSGARDPSPSRGGRSRTFVSVFSVLSTKSRERSEAVPGRSTLQRFLEVAKWQITTEHDIMKVTIVYHPPKLQCIGLSVISPAKSFGNTRESASVGFTM